VIEPRLLLIDDTLPEPSVGYGYPRAAQIVDDLRSLGVEVLLVELERRREDASGAIQHVGHNLSRVRLTGRQLDGLLADRARSYDFFWVSRLGNLKASLQALLKHRTTQPIIYDAECVSYSRHALRAEQTGAPLTTELINELRSSEYDLIRAVDEIISVNAAEASELRMATGRRVTVLGHSHQISAFRGNQSGTYLGFLGSFYNTFTPNVDTVVHLLKDILPELQSRLNVPVLIGGHRAPVLKRLLRRKGCSLGDVVFQQFGTPQEFYELTRVAVIPTRFASGTPWKLTEAVAFGVPCVTSPLIANQLDLAKPPLMVASTPQQYADAIFSLWSDRELWHKTSRLAMLYAGTFCNPAVNRTRLSNLLFSSKWRREKQGTA
jgi:glycosyltransferase involved in cell wall biosynthesis